MTAEPIAAVVADIRAGRYEHLIKDPVINGMAVIRARKPQPVVDASALYRELHHKVIDKNQGVNLYDDYPSAAPPWPDALICYVNEHGNVIVLNMTAGLWPPDLTWETDNHVKWDQLKWLIETTVWVGGRTATRNLPTTGPVHMFQHAVHADGTPADIHWVQIQNDHGPDTWEVPLLVLSSVLNFLACSNVEIAEPARPRPERRRLARTGVTVQTIVVRPPGKRRAASAQPRPVDALDVPLTSVRGSFARYGPEYDRGLLFGKYAGKFWRPAHARGAGDGEVQKDYVLRPGDTIRDADAPE